MKQLKLREDIMKGLTLLRAAARDLRTTKTHLDYIHMMLKNMAARIPHE